MGKYAKNQYTREHKLLSEYIHFMIHKYQYQRIY